MLSNIATKLSLFLLKSVSIKPKDRALIITALIDKVHILPIKDIITYGSQGEMYIQGRKLDVEQAINFKEGLQALRDSTARKVIREQLSYDAIKMGIHQGLNTDMILFSKACLYVMQEEEKLIHTIISE